jgi:hypothetical protein
LRKVAILKGEQTMGKTRVGTGRMRAHVGWDSNDSSSSQVRNMAEEEVEFDEDLMRRVTVVAPRAVEVCVDACDGLGVPAQTTWVA